MLIGSKTNNFLKKEDNYMEKVEESTPSRVIQQIKVKDIFGNENDQSSVVDLDSVKGNNWLIAMSD